jgi:ABC-type amino acid transport substrate-binding protein
MSSVEYLFASHIDIAETFAREKGWRSNGRAQWQRPDLTVVYFLSLVAQLEIVSKGEVVYVVGDEPEALRALKRRKAVIAPYDIVRA